MSDDITGKGEQLFDAQLPENNSDSAVDTDTQVKPDLDGEHKLNLDKEVVKPTAEQQLAKQIDVYTQRVVDGNMSLDDFPPELRYLKGPVQRKIDSMTKEPEIDEIIDRRLAKARGNEKFNALKVEIEGAEFTSAQKRELQAEFDENIEDGLPKHRALAKAMKLVKAGMSSKTLNQQRRNDQRLPRATYKDNEKEMELTDDNFQEVHPDKRVEAYEKMRTSSGSM